jgi:hypothetical protein
LRHAYRLYALEGAVREHQVREAVAKLQSAGLQPILAKGWAAARLYPEPALRPYGDIDLFVPAGRSSAARVALRAGTGAPLPVDLHAGLADLDDRAWDRVFARSRLVPLQGVDVRVPSAEDHLRFLCLHALRHGVARAVWLCDVAAALEAHPPDFDWDRLLEGERTRSDAVVVALGLAQVVLGAEPGPTPLGDRTARLPGWVVPATLRQWGAGSGWREPMGSFVRRPRGALAELVRHWPNPIEGTMGVGAPWNAWPRFPFQMAHAVCRGMRFARALPAHFGRGR